MLKEIEFLTTILLSITSMFQCFPPFPQFLISPGVETRGRGTRHYRHKHLSWFILLGRHNSHLEFIVLEENESFTN